MAGSKLSLVKEATQFMVQQMSSVDRLSVVSFDDKVGNKFRCIASLCTLLSPGKSFYTAHCSGARCVWWVW